MTSSVDRTQDFIRSVQLSRSKLPDLKSNGSHASVESGYESSPLVQTSRSGNQKTLKPLTNGYNSVIDERQTHKIDKSNNLSQRSQFTKAAAAIGKDLAETFGKLEQLNNLTRSQTLFDDRSLEIQHLTYMVKESMANLNHRIADLQSLSKVQSSGGKQNATHSRSILMGLQTRLAKMSDQFRTLLERRSETIKSHAARRGKYTGDSVDSGFSVTGPSQIRHTVIPSVLLKDDECARRAALTENGQNSQLTDGMDGLGDSSSSSALSRFGLEPNLGMVQKHMIADQTESYLASRADTMKSIEHTIVELGQIFEQLATMVHEQDESIRRIDTNVEDTALSIEAGHSELIRYFRSISSSRWLMIKVFGVLLIFFIIFVIFFA